MLCDKIREAQVAADRKRAGFCDARQHCNHKPMDMYMLCACTSYI